MKKFISLLLAFCLLIGSTMNVFANDSTSINATEMQVPVTYDVASSYSIYIPAELDMTSTEYTFEAAILDILPNEIVSIYCSDFVTMTNAEGHTANLSLYSNSDSNSGRVAKFECGNLTSTITMLGQMSADYAGHYTGTATFSIKLEQQ